MKFKKIKKGMEVIDFSKSKFGDVITTGSIKDLLKYDKSGDIKDRIKDQEIDYNDPAIAIKTKSSTVVYDFDSLSDFSLSIKESTKEDENMKLTKDEQEIEDQKNKDIQEKSDEDDKKSDEKSDDEDDKKSDEKSDDEDDKKSKKESDEDEDDKESDEDDKKSKEKSDDDDEDSKDNEDDKKSKEKSDDDDEDDKKSKKESISIINDRASEALDEINLSDDGESLDELLASDKTLTEEFKSKAADIFKAAVGVRVAAEVKRIQESNEDFISEQFENEIAALSEKIDDYFSYAIETFIEENKESVDKVLRNEISESFITSLKKTFTEHYVEMPSEKLDLYEDLNKNNNKIIQELDETKDELKRVKEENDTLQRERILKDASGDLCDTEQERLKSLTDILEYEDSDSFKKQVETFKETYFIQHGERENDNSDETFIKKQIIEDSDSENDNSVMGKYVRTLNRKSN